MNDLNSFIIKEDFLEIIFNCKFLNAKCFLLLNIKCKNTEYLSTKLIVDEELLEIRKNWVFHYFIPSELINKNYLLVGYKNELPIDVVEEFKPSKIYWDIDEILNCWSNDINWPEEKVKHHTFLWLDQQIVANFLDTISGGIADLCPTHWGKSYLIKKEISDWYEKTLYYYNIYLLEYKLENTLENKIYFIKNFEILYKI